MPRPLMDSETQIEDLFFDADIDTQARLLRMLQKLHRLKYRQETVAAIHERETATNA